MSADELTYKWLRGDLEVKQMKKQLIVVGNGMVGHRFVEQFVQLGGLASHDVTVFGEEKWVAYDRVHLSEYFSGRSAEDLQMSSRSWYDENGVALKSGEKVTGIDLATHQVRTDAGKFRYDTLVLATGSAPFVPPVPGIQTGNIFVYRTLEDLAQIEAAAKGSKSGAVIGGGLLGLEAAKALKDLGLQTHVVEFAPRLMPRQLDEDGGRILRKKIESLGVSVHLSRETLNIEDLGGKKQMNFKDGSNLPIDMIVVSAGIKPRDELARDAGLAVGDRGGVVVDNYLRTSDPHVYAIGEVALHGGMIYGLVAPGYEMAEVVAGNLAAAPDAPREYKGSDLSTKLKLIGIDVASFGDAFAAKGGEPVAVANHRDGIYKKLVISEDGKRLLGGILVGDAADYGQFVAMMQNNVALPPQAESLLVAGGGARPGADALPDEAKICSCNNVSKGAILGAVRGGCTELAALKNTTKAGLGCGGCVPFVNDILKTELKAQGKTVTNHLCEHFLMSRQELFSVIKIKKLRTFDEAIQQAGTGRGCEICKPTVASILASLWNDQILVHSNIQDTNDRFLANIQRGGTYSVIPRIPGGEITPEKLEILAQIGKKYGLYCKITGGQRIDFLGARLDQLPSIWKELVEAGFESGHAYGKAMRTVKSCVGSTWCRYGVQDSTAFAIRVEERYRGIRAPHKLKSAVSGCIRECAEAQSKDFGIIATENGWNLYVAGNGGSNPKHAQLLASDLDDDTCIRLIDRFLMYYIRTADRLERTAVWFNKLEGGIDALRSILIEDSLNICADLEAEMQGLVDTYVCEWKEVVENPERQRLFQQFINSKEADPTVKFVEERGQKRPIDWPRRTAGAV